MPAEDAAPAGAASQAPEPAGPTRAELLARVVELEIRLTHQERMAEELSSVIADQGRLIDRLTERLRALADRLTDAESAWRPSPQDEKPPPHY